MYNFFRYCIYEYIYIYIYIIHCALIKYAYIYMIESLCLISAKFSCCILMLDSCFSHIMKNCTLSKAPLRYIFFTL